jgi:lipopolysaccharide transport system ATP-binding protein
MSRTAIVANGLGKHYRLGRLRRGGETFREAVVDGLTTPFRRMRRAFGGDSHAAVEVGETLWALREISLSVSEGEVLGVIGRNGAGKSTLLKILSRITAPSEGEVAIAGRVGSLLEVGTGFHRELTGRENIYLNAAILGMRRVEIDLRFDEIVAFAGVERFIDTPIKHYSSGMGLRLGFAVAAHLEPEVLLVDEVLAVGDLGFQKRCLGKMSEITQSGRTIVFVSHNLYAIQSICDRVAWLDGGRLRGTGGPGEMIAAYQLAMSTEGAQHKERHDRDSPEVSIVDIRVNGVESRYVTIDKAAGLAVRWRFEVRSPVEVTLGVSLKTADGVYLSGLSTRLEGRAFEVAPGSYEAGVDLPDLVLSAGVYVLGITIMSVDGAHFYSYRSPAATLYVETPFSFDGLMSFKHDWKAPAEIGSDIDRTPVAGVRE